MMNTKLGFAHFWLTITCGYGVFFPMHFVGLAGAPRRYYDASHFDFLSETADLQPIISVFAIIGSLSQLIFLFNFFYSIFVDRRQSRILGNRIRLSGQHRLSIFTVTGLVHCQRFTVGLMTIVILLMKKISVLQTTPLKESEVGH